MLQNCKFGKIPPKRFIKYRVHDLSGCTHEHTDRQSENIMPQHLKVEVAQNDML